jgi:GNAT superfamily N-acetyltransferase
MNIEPIDQNDLIELASLQKELIDEEADLEKMLILLPIILKDSNYYLLGARKEGRLVGSLAGIVCHDLFGKCIPFMVVENVIVAKEVQRQGVGTRLMDSVETIARDRGCRHIMLVSAAERTKAKDFYHRLGYDSDHYSGFKKILKNTR